MRSATFHVTLTNRTAGVIQWTPMGSAPDDIDVAVEPSPVEARPGAPASVKVVATAPGLNWGAAREHGITVGGPSDAVGNRLELVFAQSSVFWPALAGVVGFMLFLVVAFNVLGGGGSPGDTVAAVVTSTTSSIATSSTDAPAASVTSTPTPSTTSTTIPSTTTTSTNVTAPEGDLGIEGHEMVVPPCDDVYITVLFSAIEPGVYEQQVSSRLDAHAGSSYLRTDRSCSSLRQSVNGNPIYAVFLGPFDTANEACDSLVDDSSYVRLLSETTSSEDATVDCG